MFVITVTFCSYSFDFATHSVFSLSPGLCTVAPLSTSALSIRIIFGFIEVFVAEIIASGARFEFVLRIYLTHPVRTLARTVPKNKQIHFRYLALASAPCVRAS
uniref:Uncharacterized protein n=1 Tax=Rhipicephalus zambeziensis TaxID=60191 RepID=A0A224YF74_9ACAR